MNYLLYAPESSETGQELLNWLKDKGADIQGGKDPGDSKVHHLIRWGSFKQLKYKTTGKVFNGRDAVALASNKAKALSVMKAAGIQVPVVYTGAGQDMEFPVLGRHDKHSHGSDITLCLQPSDVMVSVEKGCTHWTKFIPPKSEYRVHVFDGVPIKISEKKLTDPSNFVAYCRNFETGWTFHTPPSSSVPKLVKLEAVDAVEALGLHFAAVDIVWDGATAYVLEGNTAPGLIENGVEQYGKRFLVELT